MPSRRTWNSGRREQLLTKAVSPNFAAMAAAGGDSIEPRAFPLLDAINAATGELVANGGLNGFHAMPRDPRDATNAFGPLDPLRPDAIDLLDSDGRTEPRLWQYPVGWNLPGNGNRETPWAVLRAAAAGVGIIRRCIEARKKDVSDLAFVFAPSEDAINDAYQANPSAGRLDAEQKLREELMPEMTRLREFWARPWRSRGWDFKQWCRAALEDVLVVDGVPIYPRKTYGGDVYDLELITPETIKPLLDVRGNRPLPPFPAYQQILYGFPRGEWAATVEYDDEGNAIISNGYESSIMMYYVANARTFSPYGFSPVEQALFDSRLYLQRQKWMIAEYEDGSTPLTWVETAVPDDGQKMTLTQQRLWERAFNSKVAGNTRERARVKVLPNGWKAMQMASTDERYKPEYDLYLIKLLASHFGVTATRLGFGETNGLGGSGFSESQMAVTGELGLKPDTEVLASIINEASCQFLGMDKRICGAFVDPAQANSKEQIDGAVAQQGAGQVSVNEVRQKLGQSLLPFEEANMPFVLGGPQGIIFLEGAKATIEAAMQAQQMAAETQALGTAGKLSIEEEKLKDGQAARQEEHDFQRETREAEAELEVKKSAEANAFNRWYRKYGDNPRRPFLFKSIEPDDGWLVTEVLGPNVAAFEGWEWVANEDIEKAAKASGLSYLEWNMLHPNRPKGPNGRWVKSGSTLADALRDEAKRHAAATGVPSDASTSIKPMSTPITSGKVTTGMMISRPNSYDPSPRRVASVERDGKDFVINTEAGHPTHGRTGAATRFMQHPESSSQEEAPAPTVTQRPKVKTLPETQHAAMLAIAEQVAERAKLRLAGDSNGFQPVLADKQLGLKRATTTALARAGYVERSHNMMGDSVHLTDKGREYVASHGDRESFDAAQAQVDEHAGKAAEYREHAAGSTGELRRLDGVLERDADARRARAALERDAGLSLKQAREEDLKDQAYAAERAANGALEGASSTLEADPLPTATARTSTRKASRIKPEDLPAAHAEIDAMAANPKDGDTLRIARILEGLSRAQQKEVATRHGHKLADNSQHVHLAEDLIGDRLALSQGMRRAIGDAAPGLEMRQADFQAAHGLSGRDMERLRDLDLVEMDDEAVLLPNGENGPFVSLTSNGLRWLRETEQLEELVANWRGVDTSGGRERLSHYERELGRRVARQAQTPTPETKARARQARIDSAKAKAEFLADVEEGINTGADSATLRRMTEQSVARNNLADDPVAGHVQLNMDNASLNTAAAAWGLRRIGDEGSFDPAMHSPVGERPSVGGDVELVRPGYVMRDGDEDIQIMRAVVDARISEPEPIKPKIEPLSDARKSDLRDQRAEQLRERRREQLNATKDPKDNGPKVKALMEGVIDAADLYRKVEAGPSGQRANVHVGRVRFRDNQHGEFQVVDKEGRNAGWMTRVNRNGEEMYVVHSEDYDGGIHLEGWADSVSLGADVLVNGKFAATSRHDSRRISSGKFEAYVPKTEEQLDREEETRNREYAERRASRQATSKPLIDPGSFVTSAVNAHSLRRGDMIVVDGVAASVRLHAQSGGSVAIELDDGRVLKLGPNEPVRRVHGGNLSKAAVPDDGPGDADPKAQEPVTAPPPPPDTRWPGWMLDTAIAALWASAILEAMPGLPIGDLIRLFKRLAAEWPTTMPKWREMGKEERRGVANRVVWEMRQDGWPRKIAEKLGRAIENAHVEGSLVGQKVGQAVADATLDGGDITAGGPGGNALELSIDWGGWEPGHPEAARLLLDPGGLERLLRESGIVLDKLVEGRLDQIGRIIGEGLANGDAPKKIGQRLAELFGDRDWAHMTALTETNRAMSRASIDQYREAGMLYKGWMTAFDQRVCPLCDTNAHWPDGRPRIVPINENFPSGDPYPPGHPWCRCAPIPILNSMVPTHREA